jgi:hypothetical protein
MKNAHSISIPPEIPSYIICCIETVPCNWKKKRISLYTRVREHLQLLDDREPLKNGKRFFSFTNEKVPRAFTTSCQSKATGKRQTILHKQQKKQSTEESRELLAILGSSLNAIAAGEFRAA